MKKRVTRSRKKSLNVKLARISILITSIVISIIIITTLIEKKFYIEEEGVNASVTENNINNLEDINEEVDDINGNKYLQLQEDTIADDVAFLEKYISQQKQGIMPDGANGKKVAYLTFDDGPSETVTPLILDILKEYNIKGTFFILGKEVDKNDKTKEILKRTVEEGHAIGNHTYGHNYNYLYPNGTVDVNNFMSDIEKTNESLKNILGNDFFTRAIRFPGGHDSWKGLKAIDDIISDKDYHQVDWNALSKDSEGNSKTASELVNEVIKTVKGREKAVILMHDNYGKEETAKALPTIIEYLKSEGYEFRTMK